MHTKHLASTAIRNCSPSRLARAVGASLLAACGLAAANNAEVTLCATSAQDLQDDLTAASDGGTYAGYDVTINIAEGTYKIGTATANGPFVYSFSGAANDLFISGGFSSNCAAILGGAPTTILDGRSMSQVMRLDGANTYIVISGLTVQNGSSTANGGGLAINTITASTGSVRISNSIIQNNTTSAQGGGLALHIAGVNQYAEFGENLVAGNSADGGYGAGFINSNATGVGNIGVTMFHNTMFGNSTISPSGAGGFGCCGSPSGNSTIEDNIFWQNTNYGLYLFGVGAALYQNDYGTLGGVTPTNSNYLLTNLSTEPQFRNAAAGDFHLGSNSPLFGYAIACDAFTDLDGRALPSVGPCEPGAYEETIFTDGLEGP